MGGRVYKALSRSGSRLGRVMLIGHASSVYGFFLVNTNPGGRSGRKVTFGLPLHIRKAQSAVAEKRNRAHSSAVRVYVIACSVFPLKRIVSRDSWDPVGGVQYSSRYYESLKQQVNTFRTLRALVGRVRVFQWHDLSGNAMGYVRFARDRSARKRGLLVERQTTVGKKLGVISLRQAFERVEHNAQPRGTRGVFVEASPPSRPVR